MKNLVLWCLPLCLLFTACKKDPLKDMTGEESRIYITNYDTTANFSNYNTFAIADSVALIYNNQLQQKEQTAFDDSIISAVASTLVQRGYTRVSKDQSPDLGVTISVLKNTSTQLVSYPDYGGYYYDYWDPYSWGYPGYDYYFPAYYGAYQTNETSLAVDMIDLKNAKSNNQLKDVWSGMIRGEEIFVNQNINSQVAALFNQSSYLKK